MLDPAQAALGRSRGRAWRILAGILIAAVVVGGLAYIVFGVGVEALLEHILTMPAWLILVLVFLLPALEASAFVGVVLPGEIAVLLGGVAAGRGSVNFAAVLMAACVGAVAGDQVGYWIGHRYGQQLLRRLPDRLLDEERLENARLFVRRTGAKGVILGRWTAALRALVPGMAGTSHMPYPRFATANVVGGVLWASLVASVGYIAGDSWHRVQSALGSASTALLGLILVAALPGTSAGGSGNAAGAARRQSSLPARQRRTPRPPTATRRPSTSPPPTPRRHWHPLPARPPQASTPRPPG